MKYDTYTADDFLLDDQFLAYCRGNDQEAVLFWEQWQQANPPNLAAFREAERMYGILSGQQPRLDNSLQELEALIQQQPTPTAAPAPVLPMHKPVLRTGWWTVAASVAALVLAGWAGYWFWQQQYVTEVTAYNERRTITLPDGSTVALNSHSSVRYQRSSFTESARTIELTGEGFFDVTHTATHTPFTVRTNGPFDVQVLGTTFSVQNRPHQQRVVLNTGQVRVSFHDAQPAVTLQPGQLVETSASDPQPRQRTVRPTLYNAWIRNQLVFENASLIEVVWTLKEQFGIPVRLANTVSGNQTVTGVLPISDPETVLRAIAELSQLSLTKTDHGFVLSP
ncbi:FecR family protein [Spirosoma sordidisoli]|uniref:DUF4974 domain-containing protein n=1 Tax=Spirosoma sordidisoli TaxID=2502893 RepID=A0A4V1RW69_9BACT|nr:FecR domain-containing protein [Spirosoma sordidisoli]RYC69228.1 DUF4974 domain-containing protein [Spirosoma sordidisoli]